MSIGYVIMYYLMYIFYGATYYMVSISWSHLPALVVIG